MTDHEDFEHAAASLGMDVEKWPKEPAWAKAGGYKHPATAQCWLVWQACAKRKDLMIDLLQKQAADLNKRQSDIIERQAAELAALRGFALSLAKVAQTTLPGNYVYIAMREHNLIDENGNPSELLKGEDK